MKVLLIFAAALVAATAAGAPVKQKAKPGGAETKQNPYAMAPLDPSVEALPKGYRGHDCRTISRQIKSLRPAKDEYETTAAHAERVARFSAHPIVGTVSISDYVAFAPNHASVTTAYDADVGQFRMSGSMRALDSLIGSSLVQSVMIESKTLSSSTYVASNAYGREIDVRKTQLYACAVALPQLKLSYRSAAFDATVSLSADEARSAKENVGVLYVGQLAPPYWATYAHHIEPKLDSPTDAFWSGDALILRNAEVWLFDKETGRIHHKSKI